MFNWLFNCIRLARDHSLKYDPIEYNCIIYKLMPVRMSLLLYISSIVTSSVAAPEELVKA